MASSKELCDCYHSLTAFCIFIKGLLSNQYLEEQLTMTFHDVGGAACIDHRPKPHDYLNFADKKKEMHSLNCWLKWGHNHQFLRQSKIWRDPQLPNYSRKFLSWHQIEIETLIVQMSQKLSGCFGYSSGSRVVIMLFLTVHQKKSLHVSATWFLPFRVCKPRTSFYGLKQASIKCLVFSP